MLTKRISAKARKYITQNKSLDPADECMWEATHMNGKREGSEKSLWKSSVLVRTALQEHLGKNKVREANASPCLVQFATNWHISLKTSMPEKILCTFTKNHKVPEMCR